jgi:lipopolysaccharide/colanic/teichoic acid biosynthesis glycosyltransferase
MNALVFGVSGPSELSSVRASWKEAARTLYAVGGDTAIVGWFENGKTLGAILPDSTGTPDAIRTALAEQLRASTSVRFSLRVHAYAGPTDAARAVQADDPFRIEAAATSLQRLAYQAIKRGLDIAGSAALLLLLSPLFLLITVLMKLTSPGPILFRQARVGRMGKPFTMLKFRSMRVNAEQKLHQEFVTNFIKSGAGTNAGASDAKAPFKLANDPRVTPLGRILRKTSLDELPQLWNVLRGDMSLVGPRPPLGYEVEQYRPWHWRRVLDAKPGVTGLWQVYGRSRTTFDDMVRLDIRYIRTCSVWNDLKILVATPRAVISGTGAN